MADSAFFTEANIEKAKKHGIKFITRAPETVAVTGQLITGAYATPEAFKIIELESSQGDISKYEIQEFTEFYRDTRCNS